MRAREQTLLETGAIPAEENIIQEEMFDKVHAYVYISFAKIFS